MDQPVLTVVITYALVAVVVAALLITNARRRKTRSPARHAGAYVPRKDRREIRGATDHNGGSELVGPRSKRFPEMERR